MDIGISGYRIGVAFVLYRKMKDSDIRYLMQDIHLLSGPLIQNLALTGVIQSKTRCLEDVKGVVGGTDLPAHRRHAPGTQSDSSAQQTDDRVLYFAHCILHTAHTNMPSMGDAVGLATDYYIIHDRDTASMKPNGGTLPG